MIVTKENTREEHTMNTNHRSLRRQHKVNQLSHYLLVTRHHYMLQAWHNARLVSYHHLVSHRGIDTHTRRLSQR